MTKYYSTLQYKQYTIGQLVKDTKQYNERKKVTALIFNLQ